MLIPLAVVALSAAACSSTPSSSSSDTDQGTGETATATAEAGTDSSGSDPDAGSAASGCTDGMLAYLADHGYADVPPADPSSFTFPAGIATEATPTCYVAEEPGDGVGRASAIFTDDPAGAVAQADAAFADAGWQGAATPGAGGIWWSDGADATVATYSVGGGQLEIDGQTVAWFTWAG